MIVASPIWDHGRLDRNPRLAFAIMPFRPKWSIYVYNEFIKPVVAAAGLEAKRADEMTGRNVLQDIWKAIYTSRLVIAEISELNANVYYELGIAHTLGKKAILLTQNIDVVPFDLRQQRVIVYTDDFPGYKKLQVELAEHLAAVLAEPIDELYYLRSILGGYIVERAKVSIRLAGSAYHDAHVVDTMSIVGVRPNVVLLNKIIEHVGDVSNMQCNHRFVRSTEYADVVRVAVMFDEPYIQTGTGTDVNLSFDIARAFAGDDRRWEYDIAVEANRLEFELIVPVGFKGRVRVAEYLKPTDHDLTILVPERTDDVLIYRGAVDTPEVGHVYALVWS